MLKPFLSLRDVVILNNGFILLLYVYQDPVYVVIWWTVLKEPRCLYTQRKNNFITSNFHIETKTNNSEEYTLASSSGYLW